MFKNLLGIMGSLFRIGGPSGNGIKAEAYGLSVRDSTGTNLQRIGIARAVNPTDGSTYLDAQEKVILIQWSFAGSSPPSPGTNTGNYGMCSTSGGSFNAGAIYLDTGSALVAVTGYKGQVIATTAAFSGTVALVANGLYIATTNAAPFNWVLKGDGAPASAGLIKAILVNIGTTNASSSTTIPAASEIREVFINVGTGYSGGAGLTVVVNGSSPLTIMTSLENDPTTVALYSKEQDTVVGGSNAGPIQVQVSGGPSSGAAKVIVTYTETFLA